MDARALGVAQCQHHSVEKQALGARAKISTKHGQFAKFPLIILLISIAVRPVSLLTGKRILIIPLGPPWVPRLRSGAAPVFLTAWETLKWLTMKIIKSKFWYDLFNFDQKAINSSSGPLGGKDRITYPELHNFRFGMFCSGINWNSFSPEFSFLFDYNPWREPRRM